MKVLVINCGSSSVKFKVFEMPEELLLAEGNVEKIGEETGLFSYTKGSKQLFYRKKVDVKTHNEALSLIADTLVDEKEGIIKDVKEIKGVGHRVVHGGEGFDRSVVITDEIIKKIEEYQSLAPLHNPHNLSGIRAAMRFFPDSLQVAAFDTAFHTTTRLLPIFMPYRMSFMRSTG